MKEKDVAYFVSWCIEQYKKIANLGGAAAMELLYRYGILDYLALNYEVLHTQSPQWIMEEIALKIDEKRKEETL